jgi:hypothetical protein
MLSYLRIDPELATRAPILQIVDGTAFSLEEKAFSHA